MYVPYTDPDPQATGGVVAPTSSPCPQTSVDLHRRPIHPAPSLTSNPVARPCRRLRAKQSSCASVAAS